MTPIARQRFSLTASIGQPTMDKLREAEELLSHQVAPGDIAALLDRVLDFALPQLRKRKFAAIEAPRPCEASSSRHIPADVMRAVWERDGGQCTFESGCGHRCRARHRLEFDHVVEFARGGKTTVQNLRLRCRAHNQHTAEGAFGAEFMERKREQAKSAASRGGRVQPESAAWQRGREQATRLAQAQELVPILRRLGLRVDEACSAAAHCETLQHATLEQRVRAALVFLAPRATCIRPGLAAG